MKDDPRIACGYGHFTIPAKDFIDACEWHDGAYLEKSWQERNLSRAEVDAWFRDQMLLIAGKNPLKRGLAWAMYGVTRVFGSFFWEGNR